jgi:hypothetical protein
MEAFLLFSSLLNKPLLFHSKSKQKNDQVDDAITEQRSREAEGKEEVCFDRLDLRLLQAHPGGSLSGR